MNYEEKIKGEQALTLVWFYTMFKMIKFVLIIFLISSCSAKVDQTKKKIKKTSESKVAKHFDYMTPELGDPVHYKCSQGEMKGTSVKCVATVTINYQNLKAEKFIWNWGDGTKTESTSFETTHTYVKEGNYMGEFQMLMTKDRHLTPVYKQPIIIRNKSFGPYLELDEKIFGKPQVLEDSKNRYFDEMRNYENCITDSINSVKIFVKGGKIKRLHRELDDGVVFARDGVESHRFMAPFVKLNSSGDIIEVIGRIKSLSKSIDKFGLESRFYIGVKNAKMEDGTILNSGVSFCIGSRKLEIEIVNPGQYSINRNFRLTFWNNVKGIGKDIVYAKKLKVDETYKFSFKNLPKANYITIKTNGFDSEFTEISLLEDKKIKLHVSSRGVILFSEENIK